MTKSLQIAANLSILTSFPDIFLNNTMSSMTTNWLRTKTQAIISIKTKKLTSLFQNPRRKWDKPLSSRMMMKYRGTMLATVATSLNQPEKKVSSLIKKRGCQTKPSEQTIENISFQKRQRSKPIQKKGIGYSSASYRSPLIKCHAARQPTMT